PLTRRGSREQAAQLPVVHGLGGGPRRAARPEARLGQQVARAGDGERSVRLDPALQAQADQHGAPVGYEYRASRTRQPGGKRDLRHVRPAHHVRQRGDGTDEPQAGAGRGAPTGEEDLREVAPAGPRRGRLGGHLGMTAAAIPSERATPRVAILPWYVAAPLGAGLGVWGALAMITSAPFDNWWHNAYGLDVKVLSPPHVILALGIWAIQLGSLFLVLALQNRTSDEQRPPPYGVLAAYLVGILLQNATTLTIEQLGFANVAHSALYYKIAACALPLLLVAGARAARLRWPATTAAAAYMLISLVMIWILQLAPATPKLAPVFNPVTHMVPPPFPLLLVVPALAIDLVMRRVGPGRDWLLSLLVGLAF